jgi:hypothetical protein
MASNDDKKKAVQRGHRVQFQTPHTTLLRRTQTSSIVERCFQKCGLKGRSLIGQDWRYSRRQHAIKLPANRSSVLYLLFSPTPSPLLHFPDKWVDFDAFRRKRCAGMVPKKKIGQSCSMVRACLNLQSGSSNLKVFVRGRVRCTLLVYVYAFLVWKRAHSRLSDPVVGGVPAGQRGAWRGVTCARGGACARYSNTSSGSHPLSINRLIVHYT